MSLSKYKMKLCILYGSWENKYNLCIYNIKINWWIHIVY
jgi:hypothetical protein